MKKLVLTFLLCFFSIPSHAGQVKEILKGAGGALVQEAGEEVEGFNKKLNYYEEQLKTIEDSEERNKTVFDSGVTVTDQAVLINTIHMANSIKNEVPIPAIQDYKDIKFPNYGYNGVHPLEMSPEMYLKRCDDPLNPLECYKVPVNVDVNGAQQAIDKVPRDTPCKSDPSLNASNPGCND